MSVLLFFVSLLVVFATGSFFGFCFSQARFLLSDERKEIAAKLVFQKTRKRTHVTQDNRRIEIPAPYSSFEDFVAKNPDCCEIEQPVLRWPEGSALIEKIDDLIWRCSGMRAVRVIVKYRDWMPKDQNGSLEFRKSGKAVDVGNCGRAVFSY